MTGPQSSRYAYPDNRRDLHSRHDAAGQRYRIIMQELAARQARGDFSFREKLSDDPRTLLGIDPRPFTFSTTNQKRKRIDRKNVELGKNGAVQVHICGGLDI